MEGPWTGRGTAAAATWIFREGATTAVARGTGRGDAAAMKGPGSRCVTIFRAGKRDVLGRGGEPGAVGAESAGASGFAVEAEPPVPATAA